MAFGFYCALAARHGKGLRENLPMRPTNSALQPCGGGPRWGGEKLGLRRFRVHSVFIDEPRDAERARTLLESRLQAAREPKIPPEGGTPTRSRATELACAQGVQKSIQRQLFISPPWRSIARQGLAGLMKTWPCSIWHIAPVLLRELPLLKGYIRNPGKQEARESESTVTLRPFSVVTVRCLVSMLHQAAISLFVTFVSFCSRRIGIGANIGRMVQV